MFRRSPPEPSTGVALGAGVRVSVAAIGLGIVAETTRRPRPADSLPNDAYPSDQTRRRAYFARRLIRRTYLWCELRGPDGRATAGRLRRRRADRRPLRDRRAPDLRLWDPHPVAGGARLDGGGAPALRHARRPHATRRFALPPPLDLLHLRLPAALRAALGGLRRALRDRQGRGAGERRPERLRRGRGGGRPRHRLRPARRRRARLAPGAGRAR